MLKLSKNYFFKLLTSVALMVSYLGVDTAFALSQTVANSWADIFQELREEDEEEPPLASRGEICAISPGLFGDHNLIWSVNPLFFWQGIVEKIEIHSRETDEVLWTQEISPGSTQFIYNGPPLEPGKSYVVYFNDTSFTFRIIEPEQHIEIAADLKGLEDQQTQPGENVEAIALQRANYFVQQNLWSDVFQEMLKIENPSEELGQLIEQVPHLICPQATRAPRFR